jgi:acyl CoA:acetate/3-ketoacid CoA transferase beta subunit
LPLTGVGCVKKVVTELAVLEITSQGFKLLDTPGVTIEHIVASTEATLIMKVKFRNDTRLRLSSPNILKKIHPIDGCIFFDTVL